MLMRQSSIGVALLSAVLFTAGCAEAPTEGPLRMEVRALGSGACTGENPNPLSDMKSARIKVTGTDPQTGDFGVIFDESFSIAGGALTVPNVPEGTGHKLELFGSGGAHSWYAAAPSVTVKAATDANVQLLLTRIGATSQLPVPGSDFANVRFPAIAEMGDGRVLISGGFESSDGTTLSSPSNKWFIVNPRTAEVQSGTFGASFGGRGGHVAAFLPQTGQVLLAGGAGTLTVGTSFPVEFAKATDVKFKDAALFTPPPEGSAEGGTWSIVSNELNVARVFARVAVMADGLAVITGGGEWPLDNDPAYQRTQVFDPAPKTGDPRFLSVASFDSFAPRSGHSLTFIKRQDGLSYLLVFGGTPGQPIAEVMRQSSRQQDGVDGNFVEVTMQGNTPPNLYFHETTRLSGERFLVTGGVPHAEDALPDVGASYAYLLEYSDTDGAAPVLKSRDLSDSFKSGRVFHSAVSGDFQNVAVFGGLGAGTKAVETDKILFFDADAAVPGFTVAPESADFLARAGQASLAMASGSMIVVGGENDLGDKGGGVCGHIEIYTPSYVSK